MYAELHFSRANKKKTYKEKEKAKRGNKEEVKRNLSHRWE